MNTQELSELLLTLNQVKQDVMGAFLYALQNKRRCWAHMLWGQPGIGKTAISKEIAKEVGAALGEHVRFHAMASSTAEPWDFAGALMRAKEGNYSEYVPLRWIYEASETFPDQSPMIILLDDFPTAHPQTQAAALKLVHELRAGEHIIRNNVLILCAGNYSTDNSGAHSMLKAMGNRFRHLHARADKDVFVSYGRKNGVHPLVLAYLEVQPQNLFDFDPNGAEDAFPSPRSWENLSDFLHERGRTVIDPRAFEYYPQIAGIVGRGAAITFAAFAEHAMSAISPELICKDPMKAPMPPANEPDIVWATIVALEDHIKNHPLDWSNAVKYSVRTGINEDIGILIMSAAGEVLQRMAQKDKIAQIAKYVDLLTAGQEKFGDVLNFVYNN